MPVQELSGPCAFSEPLQYPELCFLIGLKMRIWVLSCTDDTQLFRKSKEFTKGRVEIFEFGKRR